MGLMEKFADPSLFESLGFGEKMLGSTVTMIMGMGITFCVLILLWAFVSIMGKFMSKTQKGDKASEKTVAAATPSEAAVSQVAATENQDIVAAVIAAAIAAYQENGGTGNLVVRRIRRVSGEITPWSNAAREDCIESRKF